MSISLGTAPLECIMKPEQNDELKPPVAVNAVHGKQVRDPQTQTEHHVKAEHETAEQMECD